MTTGWKVESIEALTLHRSNRIANMYVLSPYVWRTDGTFHMLVRAVPRRDDEPRLKMSEIWYGTSKDGRDFTMEIAPTLFPGPELDDLDGCEDPTVLDDGDTLRVWYTGYNSAQKTGRLLFARGDDRDSLAKVGIAVDVTPGFDDPKEAALAPIDGGWAMLFEFARDGASVIGRVEADGPDGPWHDRAEASLRAREGRWDGWHMSPGPIVDTGTDAPTMFYNGGTEDAAWRIGWATFDARLEGVVARGDEPLIVPDGSAAETNDMVFAASAVADGDDMLLYFSQADQDLRVARLRRTGK